MLPLVLLLACTPAGTIRVDLDHAGEARNYYLRVPESAGQGAPVIVGLHGGGTQSARKGRRFGAFSGWDELVDREGWVGVYPSSLDGNWYDGREGVPGGEDELGFLDAVLDDVALRADIDPERVFVTGASNGGFMTQKLLCERAQRYRAGYSVIATMAQGLPETCAPGRPVSVAFALGTDDPLVPYEGGVVAEDRGECVSADEALGFWRAHNACSEQATVEDLPDIDPDDGSTVRVSAWSCAQGTEVRLVRQEGAGHTWPGGPQYLPVSTIGTTNRDMSASEDAFAFFTRAMEVSP